MLARLLSLEKRPSSPPSPPSTTDEEPLLHSPFPPSPPSPCEKPSQRHTWHNALLLASVFGIGAVLGLVLGLGLGTGSISQRSSSVLSTLCFHPVGSKHVRADETKKAPCGDHQRVFRYNATYGLGPLARVDVDGAWAALFPGRTLITSTYERE